MTIESTSTWLPNLWYSRTFCCNIFLAAEETTLLCLLVSLRDWPSANSGMLLVSLQHLWWTLDWAWLALSCSNPKWFIRTIHWYVHNVSCLYHSVQTANHCVNAHKCLAAHLSQHVHTPGHISPLIRKDQNLLSQSFTIDSPSKCYCWNEHSLGVPHRWAYCQQCAPLLMMRYQHGTSQQPYFVVWWFLERCSCQGKLQTCKIKWTTVSLSDSKSKFLKHFHTQFSILQLELKMKPCVVHFLSRYCAQYFMFGPMFGWSGLCSINKIN